MPKQPSRIFIDCAHINFGKQPTGIPRVVLKYVEVGYAWGAANNAEVIPVAVTANGLFLCRPLPGAGAPAKLVRKAQNSENSASRSRFETGTKYLLGYLKGVVHHAVLLIAALLPLPPVKLTSVWIDNAVARGCTAFDEYSNHQNTKLINYQADAGDVLFAPAYWHDVDPEMYAELRAKGVIVVILVHDILPILFEHFYPSPWRYTFRENVRKAFDYASAFVCVSDFTRLALREFGEREKVKPVPMMTAYNGFEPLISDTAAAQIRNSGAKPIMSNGRFYAAAQLNPLLMVGSVEPKKGHVPVIKCLEAMWRSGFDRGLLIIGRVGWMERDVVAAIEGSPFLNKKLFWFTDIDDFDLALAYNLCHALIFSSLAEGFGIPMIEASYYGKPTIAYDTPIVREILGDRALLFSTAHDFVQHLINLEDADVYAAASARAKALGWPTWQDYTPQVFDVIARLQRNVDKLPDQVSRKPDAIASLARPMPQGI